MAEQCIYLGGDSYCDLEVQDIEQDRIGMVTCRPCLENVIRTGNYIRAKAEARMAELGQEVVGG